MEQEAKDPALVWHEDSAIWEIIAGEFVVQQADPIARDRTALLSRARERAAGARDSITAGNLDAAGHGLIGCALAIALAAWLEGGAETPAPNYASELAAAVSWQAAPPSEGDLTVLISQLTERERSQPANGVGPTSWELAVRAGAYAAGLSPHITRRRQRRDLLADAAA
jgi:hypothetical protein